MQLRFDLFIKLKYQRSIVILFVGIKYFMHDLLYDVNNYTWPAKYRYASHTDDTVNDVSAPSGINSP